MIEEDKKNQGGFLSTLFGFGKKKRVEEKPVVKDWVALLQEGCPRKLRGINGGYGAGNKPSGRNANTSQLELLFEGGSKLKCYYDAVTFFDVGGAIADEKKKLSQVSESLSVYETHEIFPELKGKSIILFKPIERWLGGGGRFTLFFDDGVVLEMYAGNSAGITYRVSEEDLLVKKNEKAKITAELVELEQLKVLNG